MFDAARAIGSHRPAANAKIVKDTQPKKDVNPRGMPNFRMDSVLGGLNVKSPEARPSFTNGSRRTAIASKVVVMPNETSVAVAAPDIPIIGKGPRPKMRIGSSARLQRQPTKVQKPAYRVCPWPVRIPARTALSTHKNPPGVTIEKYAFSAILTLAECPARSISVLPTGMVAMKTGIVMSDSQSPCANDRTA